MVRPFDVLGSHWLAIGLVLVATGAIAAAFALRRPRTAWLALAYVTGPLGLGGLFLGKVIFELFDYKIPATTVPLLLAGIGFGLATVVMLATRGWSFRVGLTLGALTLFGLGGAFLPGITRGLTEAVRSFRGLEFVRPWWLVLLIFVPLIFLISRRSLSGLGPVRKWSAISLRALLIALLALALAEPRLRRPSEHVTVLFVVDRSFSVPQDLDGDKPATEAVDRRWERMKRFIETAVTKRGPDKRDDKAGLILFGKRPKLALPPSDAPTWPVDERMAGPIDGNYTDIAAALKLALASFPEGTGKRIVLVSDGNENIGSSEEQATLAKQNGVQIDTVALAPGFRNENEVLVQAVEAPQVTAQGQRLPVRVLIRNATPDRVVDGLLEVLKSSSGENKGIEIQDSPQVLIGGPTPKVRLLPGLNVFRFTDRVDPQGDTAFAYRATFSPISSQPVGGGRMVEGLPGDRAANNRVEAAVVSRGQRRVLLLDENVPGTGTSQHAYLLDTLRREKIRVDRLPTEKLPAGKGELGVFLSNYDCVLLANTPYDRFTTDQAETIRTAVFDQGCGLVMIGGPDSFGPGGYQGTPIEAALPVDCEIKALKAAGKGGLVLIMHASEMADGNKWQKDIAKLAIRRLGPADMVGVLQYGFGGGQGVNWHIPFQECGEADNRDRLLNLVDRMVPGDMPDFDPFLKAAYDTLTDKKYDLAVKHTILISDGDPNYSGPGVKAVKDMADAGVTCSTVGVATHGGAEKSRLKKIAEGTKDGAGKPGNFYDVTDPSQLPAIYVKESRRVSQSFIYDKRFDPALRLISGPSEGLPNKLPGLFGFVRTTLKANTLVEMQVEGPSPFPDQKFPVLASWRYGLGKAVAFTADARTQPGAVKQWWDRDWVSSELYRNFWKQVLNWAMREPERGKLSLVTEYRDGKVRVTADLRDEKDKPVGGLALKGAVTPPTPPPPGEKPPTIEFKPKGGGLYEAEFTAEEAGSYFVNVQALEPERDATGKVVLNPDGTPKNKVFDASRAGVTVPYSPEFADLESNTPLMKRLSEQTGGNFHTEDPADLEQMLKSNEIFRDAPSTTRALLPFWFWLVFAAGMLLLVDVGIRRIAIEWKEVSTAADRVWGGLRRQAVADDDGANLDRLLRRKAKAGEVIDRGRTTRRFDPTTATATDPAPLGADEYAGGTGGSILPVTDPGKRTAPPPEDDANDPFARLKKAKDRAKRKTDDDRS